MKHLTQQESEILGHSIASLVLQYEFPKECIEQLGWLRTRVMHRTLWDRLLDYFGIA